MFSNNERQRLVDRGRELIGNSTGGIDQIPFLGGLIGRGLSYLVPGSGIQYIPYTKVIFRVLKWSLTLEFEYFLYLISEYDSLCGEQGYPGYAVYYKRRSDKVEAQDVADLDVFVQLLEIDSKLGSVNEDQLAGLLICPFPNLEMINVFFNVFALFHWSFRPFQHRIILQRI